MAPGRLHNPGKNRMILTPHCLPHVLSALTPAARSGLLEAVARREAEAF
jgi:hypothetical protein